MASLASSLAGPFSFSRAFSFSFIYLARACRELVVHVGIFLSRNINARSVVASAEITCATEFPAVTTTGRRRKEHEKVTVHRARSINIYIYFTRKSV